MIIRFTIGFHKHFWISNSISKVSPSQFSQRSCSTKSRLAIADESNLQPCLISTVLRYGSPSSAWAYCFATHKNVCMFWHDLTYSQKSSWLRMNNIPRPCVFLTRSSMVSPWRWVSWWSFTSFGMGRLLQEWRCRHIPTIVLSASRACLSSLSTSANKSSRQPFFRHQWHSITRGHSVSHLPKTSCQMNGLTFTITTFGIWTEDDQEGSFSYNLMLKRILLSNSITYDICGNLYACTAIAKEYVLKYWKIVVELWTPRTQAHFTWHSQRRSREYHLHQSMHRIMGTMRRTNHCDPGRSLWSVHSHIANTVWEMIVQVMKLCLNALLALEFYKFVHSDYLSTAAYRASSSWGHLRYLIWVTCEARRDPAQTDCV